MMSPPMHLLCRCVSRSGVCHCQYPCKIPSSTFTYFCLRMQFSCLVLRTREDLLSLQMISRRRWVFAVQREKDPTLMGSSRVALFYQKLFKNEIEVWHSYIKWETRSSWELRRVFPFFIHSQHCSLSCLTNQRPIDGGNNIFRCAKVKGLKMGLLRRRQDQWDKGRPRFTPFTFGISLQLTWDFCQCLTISREGSQSQGMTFFLHQFISTSKLKFSICFKVRKWTSSTLRESSSS